MTRAILVSAVLLISGTPLLADAPNPFDLVQGLRENNMSDLAIEYLEELEKKNPTADMSAVIPLERAKTRLLLAQQETDESIRDAGIALAKSEFDKFLLAHAKHPRAAEASLALARVYSLQAKTALLRTARMDVTGPDGKPNPDKVKGKKAAYAAIRPLFTKAADLFGDASKAIKAILDEQTIDPYRKRTLTKESLQADLDRATNHFNLAETYYAPEAAEQLKRAEALKQTRKYFDDLSKVDTNNSICWVARAWTGACDVELSELTKAKETFQAIRSEAARSPAGRDGIRMVEFFECQNDFLSARNADPAVIRPARNKARTWLERDTYRPKMTPERLSVTYYYAFLTQKEAERDNGNVYEKAKNNDPDAPRKLLSVSGTARGLLVEAAREYRKLTDFENDYTQRANTQRLRALRMMVGAATRAPLQYTTFDECLMAATVRLSNLEESKDDTEGEPAGKSKKAIAQDEVIALFERANELITPAVPIKDVLDAKFLQSVAYLQCDRPHQAAVLAEHLARTNRGALAARASAVAIESYMESRKKLDPADSDSRSVDRQRAIRLGLATDQAMKSDAAVDNIRYRLGQLYLEEKQFQEAYDILVKVNLGFAGIAPARTMLGRAAFMLTVSKDSTLDETAKNALRQKTIAMCEAVPEPANPTQMKPYLGLRNVLAQLYLVQPGGHGKAESVAAASAKRANESSLPEGDKKASAFSAEEVRLRAVYAQAYPLYSGGKYKELSDKLTPVLLAMKKNGPASKAVEGYRGKEPEPEQGDTGAAVVAADNLDRFGREIIVLALQGRIREGNVEAAAETFKLLETLGGSVEGTTDALLRLVVLVRPQIDELKKQNKTEEAQKFVEVVGKLLSEQAGKDKLAARPKSLMGRGLRDLGLHEDAIKVLTTVEVPPAELLKQDSRQLDPESREKVVAHQIAQIELIRAYRLSQQFDKADELLTSALGKDGKSGWAKALDFKRERAYVLEDRASAATDVTKKREGWTLALKEWTETLRPYVTTVSAPIRPDPAKPGQDLDQIRQNREKLYPVILDLFVEEKRCLAKANRELLGANPAKVTDAHNNLGKAISRLEKGYSKGLTADVRQRFHGLLEEFPDMKKGYTEAGGVAFLDPTQPLPEPPPPPAAATPTEKK